MTCTQEIKYAFGLELINTSVLVNSDILLERERERRRRMSLRTRTRVTR